MNDIIHPIGHALAWHAYWAGLCQELGVPQESDYIPIPSGRYITAEGKHPIIRGVSPAGDEYVVSGNRMARRLELVLMREASGEAPALTRVKADEPGWLWFITRN